MPTLELTNQEGQIAAYVPGLRVTRPDLLHPAHYYAAGNYPAGNVLLLNMRLDRATVSTYLDLDDATQRSIAQQLLQQPNIPVILRTVAGPNITLTSPQSPVKLRELANILALADANKPARRNWEEAIRDFERERM